MKKSAIAVVLLLIATLFASEKFTGKVVSVSDGDTVKLLRDRKAVKVRLFGIDAPEREQPQGKRATRFLADLCEGKSVDVVVRKTDGSGRIYVDLSLDGKNLNHAMVENGYAWYRKKHAPDDPVLPKLQKKAQQEKRGLWKEKNPQKPWEWRDEHRVARPKKVKK